MLALAQPDADRQGTRRNGPSQRDASYRCRLVDSTRRVDGRGVVASRGE